MDSVRESVKAFFESAPLLTWVRIDDLETKSSLKPRLLDLDCSKCKVSRPFIDIRMSGTANSDPSANLFTEKSGTLWYRFNCTACSTNAQEFWIEWSKSDDNKIQVRKLGQSPPWELAIPNSVKKHLGSDSQIYTNAKICISQGYGIAACAYMRRLLEEQIGPILKLIIEAKTLMDPHDSSIDIIRSALESKSFDEKARVAYSHAPESIIVDGQNPLKKLHSLFSKALHSLDDDESNIVALQLSFAFEYVVTELGYVIINRKRYIESLSKLPDS